MSYTVKQLAQLAGVTVRTLHYYDEIGLLKPSFVRENGYRSYEEEDLAKLQQILFFRELDFALEDIVQIINAPGYRTLEALADQKMLLEMKRARLDNLLETIKTTMIKLNEGKNMSNEERFAAFTDDYLEKYKDEVKARWGETEEYKQSVERAKHWTKKDIERFKAEGQDITLALAQGIEKGITHPEVQVQIGRHFQHMNQFYDCSYSLYRNLGKMYFEDARFAENYNKVAPHLAEFMRDAIAYYCDQHEK